jgi:transglutaminase-like putative cysteine protease
MDFSAWFEAWLDGEWMTFDARNNAPRIGRVLMATGRDAADVALTTSFGRADLSYFYVVSEVEIPVPVDEQFVDPISGLPYFVSPPGA